MSHVKCNYYSKYRVSVRDCGCRKLHPGVRRLDFADSESAHFRYEASQIGDHSAVARRTRTRRTPDFDRVRLPSQIPGMLRKQRKGNVPDTGGDIHKAKRRAADIDDAALQPGK